MGSLGSLAIGLSVVFVGFLLVLLAELYYLIYWKRRHLGRGRINRRSSRNAEVGLLDENRLQRQEEDQDDDEEEEQELREVNVIANRHQSFHCELSSTKLFPVSSEALDHAELSHYLMGPSRFLFTIREETKEELESEVVSRSRNASLDLAMLQPPIFSEPGTPHETPFVTPPSSPSLFSTPQGTPSPSPSRAAAAATIRALSREPPMHCAIFIPSPQRGFPAASSASPGSRRLHSPCSSRTTMMMMLLNGSPPASPNSPAVYRTPPTHLLCR